MPQSAENVLDHALLFCEPEYTKMLAKKKLKFECPHSKKAVSTQQKYTETWEYREKNLGREALVVNPAKACQPLGAVFAAAGFERTISFVHGSQGCVAYYRSHLSRHFKEPSSAVSSSMTEDAAVFGGLKNMVEGLANAFTLYDPKMIAVSTTCMAEVIGDDLHGFIENAKNQGSVPPDFNVPFAHTPAFVGSHVDGYDSMVKGVLENFWTSIERVQAPTMINIIPGFDGFCVGNNREIKRLLDTMEVSYVFIQDASDQFDTPSDGEYRMYDGGTKIEDVKAAKHAEATISLQHYNTRKTLDYCREVGQTTASFHYPLGIAGTDEFLMRISDLSKRKIPASIDRERGRLVDAMADSQSWLHGKKYGIYGDPDFVYAMARFVMETGGEPTHCLATNGTVAWEAEMKELLATSQFGGGAQVWTGKDLWAMRSLLLTEPVDLLIGNSYGKYLERDTGTALVRLTFPIFDRHHHHRFPLMGYQGGLRLLTVILDKIFDELDKKTMKLGVTDYSYDLTR